MAVLSTVKLGAVAVCANFVGASAYDTSVQAKLSVSHGMQRQEKQLGDSMKKPWPKDYRLIKIENKYLKITVDDQNGRLYNNMLVKVDSNAPKTPKHWEVPVYAKHSDKSGLFKGGRKVELLKPGGPVQFRSEVKVNLSDFGIKDFKGCCQYHFEDYRKLGELIGKTWSEKGWKAELDRRHKEIEQHKKTIETQRQLEFLEIVWGLFMPGEKNFESKKNKFLELRDIKSMNKKFKNINIKLLKENFLKITKESMEKQKKYILFAKIQREKARNEVLRKRQEEAIKQKILQDKEDEESFKKLTKRKGFLYLLLESLAKQYLQYHIKIGDILDLQNMTQQKAEEAIYNFKDSFAEPVFEISAYTDYTQESLAENLLHSQECRTINKNNKHYCASGKLCEGGYAFKKDKVVRLLVLQEPRYDVDDQLSDHNGALKKERLAPWILNLSEFYRKQGKILQIFWKRVESKHEKLESFLNDQVNKNNWVDKMDIVWFAYHGGYWQSVNNRPSMDYFGGHDVEITPLAKPLSKLMKKGGAILAWTCYGSGPIGHMFKPGNNEPNPLEKKDIYALAMNSQYCPGDMKIEEKYVPICGDRDILPVLFEQWYNAEKSKGPIYVKGNDAGTIGRMMMNTKYITKYVPGGVYPGVETLKFRHIDESGNVYEGHLKNGKYHGQGKMTYVDKTVHEGQWANGQKVIEIE